MQQKRMNRKVPNDVGAKRGSRYRVIRPQAGFTLLEIMLTTAIILILTVSGMLTWFGYTSSQAVNVASRDLLSLLHEAQANSTGRINNNPWGVLVVNDPTAGPYAEIFEGSSYSASGVSRRVNWPDVTMTNPPLGESRVALFLERSGRLATEDDIWVRYVDQTNNDIKVARKSAGIQIFSDDFTGTDDDSWDSTKWTTSTSSGTADIQGNEGRLQFSGSSNARAAVVANHPDQSDMEILFKARMAQTGTRGRFHAALRHDGQWVDSGANFFIPNNGYGVRRDTDNNAVSLFEYSAGVGSLLGSFAGPDRTNDFWVRFRVTGTEQKVKMWVDGASEPGSWDLEVTDSVHSSGGSGLIFAREGGSFEMYIDDLTISTAMGGGCANGAADWTCWTVGTMNASSPDYEGGIHADANGSVWMAYGEYDGMMVGSLVAAHYVGSGGNCDDSFSGSDAWGCEYVKTTNVDVEDSDLRISTSGVPYISWEDSLSGSLWVANYTGSGVETSCDVGGSADWNCTNVHTTNDGDAQIAFDDSDNPWVVGEEGDIGIARYTGTGVEMTCAGSNDWYCEQIADNADFGNNLANASIAFGGGRMWVAFYETVVDDLYVAMYTGTGTETSCGSSDNWDCTLLHSALAIRDHNGVAVDKQGNPWITYVDSTAIDLWVARYVGSGMGSGCVSANWTCELVVATDNVGIQPEIEFLSDGTAVIAYANTSGDGSTWFATYTGTETETSCGGGSSDWICEVIDNPAGVDVGGIVALGGGSSRFRIRFERELDDGFMVRNIFVNAFGGILMTETD